MTETTTLDREAVLLKIDEVMRTAWPLRSMSLTELSAITAESEIALLEMLNDEWERFSLLDYSYGTVVESRDEVMRRALGYLIGRGWCRQQDIESHIGAAGVVHSVLGWLTGVGLLDGKDERDGASWRFPEEHITELGIEDWGCPDVTMKTVLNLWKTGQSV